MKKPKKYSSDKLKAEILALAKSLRLADKWAETIATKTVTHVDKWLEKHTIVTDEDVHRVAYKKLKELSADVAYIYKNRDKII